MEILVQHRRLLRDASRLEALLATGASPADQAGPWRAELGESLDQFIEQLQHHFVAEVETTAAEPALLRDPVLRARVHALDAEHEDLLQAFRAARAAALDPHRPASEVCEVVTAAIRDFRDHEARENELFGELSGKSLSSI